MEGNESNQAFTTGVNLKTIKEDLSADARFVGPSKSCNGKSLPKKINDYLDEVSVNVDLNTNPKLKKEYQRLVDLLDSYKRLTERQQENENYIPYKRGTTVVDKSKVITPKQPEIYAALYPELYRDIREEEKKRLITKFTKKRYFTPVERVLPSNTAPLFIPQDRRQNEKDRFCRIVSNAPSSFHNPVVGISSVRKSSKPSRIIKDVKYKVENVREKEIDRLAKIFASSLPSDTKYLPKTRSRSFQSDNRSIQDQLNNETLRLHRQESVEEADMCKTSYNQENINPQTGTSKNMVRVGEYSPLNGNQRGKTTLGIGEHEEQRKHLTEERKREYRTLMATKETTDLKTKAIQSYEYEKRIPKLSSASTQTDSEDSSCSFIDMHDYSDTNPTEFDSPQQSTANSPRRKRRTDLSPREKLLSDLYGTPALSNFQAFRDEKEKQAAYAEALRSQIEEKRRLEEEKKHREQLQEELIEKRIREQAEKLRLEYIREQNKKSDRLKQKQMQDEILRKRFAELELESNELKKQGMLKKLSKNEDDESQSRSLRSRRLLQRRQTSHSPVSARNRAAEYSLPLNAYIRSPVLEAAPLLDSDRQNILSVQAGNLRRGSNNNLDEEATALAALGPGVNLLSNDYELNEFLGSDNKDQDFKSEIQLTNSTKNNSSSIGPTSTKYVNHRTQDIDKHHYHHLDEDLSNNSMNDHLESPLRLSNGPQEKINRPKSPILPAVKTEMLLKKNSKGLDEKWKASTSPVVELNRSTIDQSINRIESPDCRTIVTNLGEFRRKLAQEYQLLEQRMKRDDS